MASINLKGYLREPLGEASGGNKIVFTHVSTTGEVIAGSKSTHKVEIGGYYDIDIEYGNVAIATSDLNSRSWQYHGTTTINQDTTATTLPTLLNSFVPPTDDQILLFQDLVKDAEDARDASQGFSDDSEASAIRSEEAAQDSFDNTVLMNEQEARATNATNNNHFDASGLVNMGKSYDASGTVNVNEGLWTLPTSDAFANIITLGRGSSPTGTSKTDFAVTHIAGSVINLLGTRDAQLSNIPEFRFQLPEAEDGTRIYDSTGDVRGSGKASLDLKVDVDPKYGDAPTGTEAQILREAVARAFEGILNKDAIAGNSGTNNVVVDQDSRAIQWDSVSTSGAGALFGTNQTVVVGEKYILSGAASSTSAGTPVSFVDSAGTFGGGVISLGITTDGGLDNYSVFEVELTAVRGFTGGISTGFIEIFYNTSSNLRSLEGVSLRRSTEEVVTHPVDLVGLEYYEEELTGTQEIFECIQSLSPTFGTTNVPTVLSTRPLSYFQQYDGQFSEVTADPDYINDRYRCVVWDDLTEPQRRKVAAYMGEKLFMGVNGFPVNGRLRTRTIRGAGNGDWDTVDSTEGLFSYSLSGPVLRVSPQGDGNTGNAFAQSAPYYYGDHSSNWNRQQGVFTASGTNGLPVGSVAYQGRCFFYVVATVPRLNDGFYHENLNPYGSVADLNGKKWHETTFDFETTADCFDRSKISHD